MSKIFCLIGLHWWVASDGFANGHGGYEDDGAWGVYKVTCGNCGKEKSL